jgi:hypothetical protein
MITKLALTVNRGYTLIELFERFSRRKFSELVLKTILFRKVIP